MAKYDQKLQPFIEQLNSFKLLRVVGVFLTVLAAIFLYSTLSDFTTYKRAIGNNQLDLRQVPLSALPFKAALEEDDTIDPEEKLALVEAILARDPRDRAALNARLDIAATSGQHDVFINTFDLIYRLSPSRKARFDEEFAKLYQFPWFRETMHDAVKTPKEWHERSIRVMIKNAQSLSQLPYPEFLLSDSLNQDVQKTLVQQQIQKMVALGGDAKAYDIWSKFHNVQPVAGQIINGELNRPLRLFPFDWQSYEAWPSVETQWISGVGVQISIRNDDKDAIALQQRFPAPPAGRYEFSYTANELAGQRFGTLLWQAYCIKTGTEILNITVKQGQNSDVVTIPETCKFIALYLNKAPSLQRGWIRATLGDVFLKPVKQ